jgi:TPR repeat protein
MTTRNYILTLVINLMVIHGIAFAQTSPTDPEGEAHGAKLYRAGLYLEALAHWEDRAKLGDAGSAFRAGVEYFDAKIVARDFAKARDFWTISADGGDPRGMTDLAAMYDYGNGVGVDRKRAAELYGRAARKGFPDAMFNIASMLMNGDGVRRDVVEAYKYYILADAQGFAAFAGTIMKELEGEMSPDQLVEAKRRAAAFQPEN